MSDIYSRIPMLRELKDRALFIGWIAGLVIAGALLWTLSRPLLSGYLLRSVNNSLEIAGETRRLAAPLPRPPVKPAPPGIWYTLRDSEDLLFVFTIMQDGIMIPCGAQVTREGTVAEIFPVSGHARKVFDRLPGGIIRIYTRRIESIAAQWSDQ